MHRLKSDIAIIICSRGREDYLARLIADMLGSYAPALAAGGMSACTFVYAQNYSATFLASLSTRHAAALADGRLIIFVAERAHQRIGDVFATAIAALHERLDYQLAMLMDDDSLYHADPEIDENLRHAARDFLQHKDRAYSIKLGRQRGLEYWPFIDPDGPVMPFKEKMMWVSRAVLDEVLAHPRFAELSIGEDVVISSIAWQGDASRCFGVTGLATFLHLGFEPDGDVVAPPIAGGYGELVGYDETKEKDVELGKYAAAFRSGTTPYHIMPDLFVDEDHPHHTFNGIRPEAVVRYGVRDRFIRRLHRAG